MQRSLIRPSSRNCTDTNTQSSPLQITALDLSYIRTHRQFCLTPIYKFFLLKNQQEDTMQELNQEAQKNIHSK